MAEVIFKSLDKTARNATFSVDGVDVTRNIPSEYNGTIDDYLKALGNGLITEFELYNSKEKEITDPVEVVEDYSFEIKEEEEEEE